MNRIVQALYETFDKSARFTLGYAVLSLFLTSCLSQVGPIPVEPPIVYIDGSVKAHINGGHSDAILQAGRPQAPIPDDAATAKFFIGSWESLPANRSQYQYSRFQTTVENTCETLPQGDDQLARYELYNFSGTVVKQDETRISVVTCPGGQP